MLQNQANDAFIEPAYYQLSMNAQGDIVNKQTISQELFTAMACSPNQHIWLNACAGSGKTWLLVSRIVRILLQGTPVASILALTFTKDAAFEMKTRLLSWLAEFSQLNDDDLTKALKERGLQNNEINAELLKKARQLHHEVLSTGQNLAIMTFDVWFLQLLNLQPLNMQPSTVSMHSKNKRLYDQALQDFLQQQLSSHHQNLFKQFYSAYVESSEDIYQSNLLINLWQKRQFLKQLNWQTQLSTEPQTVAMPCPKLLFDTLEVLINFLQNNELNGKDVRKKVSLLIVPLQTILAQFKKDLIENQANHLDLSENITNINFVLKTTQLYKQVLDLCLTLKQSIKSLFTSKKESEQTKQKTWHQLVYCLQLEYQQSYSQAYLQIAHCLIGAYQTFKSQQQVLDFNDCADLAYAAMQNDACNEYMFCQLDQRYEHILVDEFQDTNLLQWHILLSWLQAYQGQNLPTLFIVGDEKQAIYGFRGSDMRMMKLLAQARQHHLFDYVLHEVDKPWCLLQTQHSRRCSAAIINAMNICLSTINYEAFLPHTAQNHPSINFAYRLPWQPDIETIIIHLIEHLKQLKAQNKIQNWHEVLILSTKRTHWPLIEQLFKTHNLPLFSQLPGSLLKQKLAIDLIHVMHFIVQPNNFSYVYLLQQSQFFMLAEANFCQSLAWQALCQKVLTSSAFEGFVSIVAYLKQYILEFKQQSLENAHSIAVLDRLTELALNFKGARFSHFIDWLSSLDEDQTKTIAQESPAQQSIKQNAIELNTIHGVKGLERNYVVLLDISLQNIDIDMLYEWPLNHAYPQSVLLGKKDSLEHCYQQNFEKTVHEKQQANYNLLYVAMTRAKYGLIVCGKLNSKQLKNFEDQAQELINDKDINPDSWQYALNKLPIYEEQTLNDAQNMFNILENLPQEEDPFAFLNKSTQTIQTIDSTMQSTKQSTKQTIAFNQTNDELCMQTFLQNYGIKYEAQIAPDIGQQIGQYMHRLLEYQLIEREQYYQHQKNQATNSIINSHFPALSLSDAEQILGIYQDALVTKAYHKAQQLLNQPHLQKWFNPMHYQNAYNEYILYNHENQQLFRLDRLVETEQALIILDYKFNEFNQEDEKNQTYLKAYEAQLKNYKQQLALLYNQSNCKHKTIQAYLLNPNGDCLEV